MLIQIVRVCLDGKTSRLMRPGDTIDVSQDRAEAYIRSGHGVALEAQPKPEPKPRPPGKRRKQVTKE